MNFASQGFDGDGGTALLFDTTGCEGDAAVTLDDRGKFDHYYMLADGV